MKLSSVLSLIGKVLLTLLLIMPILGATGLFPPPTPDLFNTPQAFQFIDLLMKSWYVVVMEAVVFVLAIVCLWTKRTALAALLLLPITLNIVGFHLFLDGGLHKPGAVLGDALFLLNIAFLWQQRKHYRPLLKQDA